MPKNVTFGAVFWNPSRFFRPLSLAKLLPMIRAAASLLKAQEADPNSSGET